MFFLAGATFLVIRQRQEVARVSRFATWAEVRECCGHAPVAEVPLEGRVEPPDPPPLGKRARLNVALVLVFTQGVQIVIVGLVIGLFYVAFGLVAVREPTMEAWIGSELDRIGEVQLFGHPVLLTWDLIRVAGLVAAFSALQFTFSALTDEQYRKEFFEGILVEMRESLATRALYLDALVLHDADTGVAEEG
jgi:hypothetical protein